MIRSSTFYGNILNFQCKTFKGMFLKKIFTNSMLLSMKQMKQKKIYKTCLKSLRNPGGHARFCANTAHFIRVIKRHYLLIEKGIEKMTFQKLLRLSSLPLFQQLKVQIYHLQR